MMVITKAIFLMVAENGGIFWMEKRGYSGLLDFGFWSTVRSGCCSAITTFVDWILMCPVEHVIRVAEIMGQSFLFNMGGAILTCSIMVKRCSKCF